MAQDRPAHLEQPDCSSQRLGAGGLDSEICESLNSSGRHESPMRANLQPQFFPERLALLEALEETHRER